MWYSLIWRHLLDLLLVALVMRQPVMAFGDADLRVVARALLDAQQHRDDARLVGLKRQRQQVEHQVRVLGEVGRHARRRRVDRRTDDRALLRSAC